MRGWWLCLLFPGLAHAQGQPVVAVFELEAPPGVVTERDREVLGKLINTELASSPRFKLVPPQEVRRALLEKKRESYKDCYDESCQIEIGKELAASHSLGCSLQRLGSEFIISLTLYDLRESVTAGAAQKTGGCAPDALARLAKAAAQELGGAKTSSARDEPPPPRLQSTDYAALAAEAEAAQREADRIREAAEAVRREHEAKLRAEEAAREKVRAERLARLEDAWSNVVKFATTTAMERGRRIGVLEQFLKEYATDNPREGEAKDMLATLRAGKEPAGGARGRMVRVPGGPFFMGCNPKVDTECDDDEKPGKTVQVAAFKIDEVEVTVAAYAACVKAGACTKPDAGGYQGSCNWDKIDRGNHPVNCVDWNQATAYCGWAKKRLPTEAEWEKAARGTDGRKYSWGNEGYGGDKLANIADETAKRDNPAWTIAAGYDDGFSYTAPAGSFKAGASPYGALDMMGNVWEWMLDWYKSGEFRSIRGGCWDDAPRVARASNRYASPPGYRDSNLGFRCAQSE